MKPVLKLSGFLFLMFECLFQGMVTGQNYKAIRTDASYYFSDMIAIRVDSVAISGMDTLYFNFHQIRPVDYNCFVPDGASWLGDPVIEKPGGIFLFKSVDNYSGQQTDTLVIKTQAALNDKWIFTGFPYSNDLIEAQLTSIQNMSFIGLTDSVKIITLIRKDSNGQVIADAINGEEIRLSKNYGLIRLPKFDDFQEYISFYDISGKTNPVTGRVSPDIKAVFDFEVGDEIHIREYYSPFYFTTGTTQMTIKKITAKTIAPSNDWISYTYDICWQKTLISAPEFIPDYTSGTLIYNDTIFFNSELAHELTTEPDESNTVYNGWLGNSLGFSKFARPAKYMDCINVFNGPMPGENCWSMVMVDGACCPYYIAGLGGPYYDCPAIINWDTQIVEIVYYKKGSETWGTPLDCDSLLQVSLPEYALNQNLKLHPNPTSGTITLSAPYRIALPCKLEIFDLSGRLSGEFVLNQQTQSFDLTYLPKGIYMYKLISVNAEVFRGEIIRQ